MRARPVCIAVLGGSLVAGGPAFAQGQPATETPKEDPARLEARKLAEQGDQAFTIGRCDKAIPLWERANDKFNAPTILFRIGRCQALMGNVVEATKTLETVAAHPTETDEPTAFAVARNQATNELPKLRARIAHLRVEVDTAGLRVTPVVRVDVGKLPDADRSLAVDPGEHLVRVEAGEKYWETTVRVEEGRTRTVRVGLKQVHQPAPPRTQRTVGFMIGGVGLASLAVGAYFARSASSTASDLDSVCGPDRKACPPDRQGDIDRLQNRALLADLTLGGGAALLAAGTIVVLTEEKPKREAPRIQVFPIGLGGGVRATF